MAETYSDDVKKQLARKIELFIFTYNRAPFLENTLRQLAESPFSECKITVVDNASTDGTTEICERAAKMIPQFRHVRHRANLGCSANYLRAVELAGSLYTWVLCDDDSFDFSKAG